MPANNVKFDCYQLGLIGVRFFYGKHAVAYLKQQVYKHVMVLRSQPLPQVLRNPVPKLTCRGGITRF